MTQMTRRAALTAMSELPALPVPAFPLTGLTAPEISRRIDHHVECIKALHPIRFPAVKSWEVVRVGPRTIGAGSVLILARR